MVSSSPKDDASPNEAEDNDYAEGVKDGKKIPTPRRRTKTGCLTCRRRRIKCGEERPICKNCVKSKRECAGYVQPLVYKQQQPHTSYPDHRIGASQFQSSAPNFHQFQTTSSDILDATQHYQQTEQTQPGLPPSTSSWAWPPLPTSQALAEQLQWPEGEFDWSELQRAKAHPPLHINTAISASNWPSQLPFSSMSHDPGRRPSEAFTEGTNSTGPGSASRSTASTPYRRHPSATDASFTVFPVEPLNADATKAFENARRTNYTHEPHPLRRSSGLSIHEEHPAQYDNYGFLQRKSVAQSDWRASAHTVLHQATVDEAEDPDDPFDVEFDDVPELFEDYPTEDAMKMLQQHKQSRKYYANTLVHYRKPNLVSPILEDKYSNSFSHFVSYLVPCISIFERPPTVNMNGLVKSTWGLHLPSAAVSRSALAHAILALGALHLSALKGTSEDAAVKHFTYALRRLGKLLAMSNRRHEAATLATVLLLSFYEVVSGDHSRWIMHLSGAGSFLMEHDFTSMIRTVRRMRSRARNNIQQPWVSRGSPLSHSDYVRIADIPEALLHDDDWDIDADLIGRLTGLSVDYEEQSEPSLNAQDVSELTEKEVEDWKVKMDLYWWYCKMDIYHSALSGDPLLMSFEQWKHCPPRGPLGKSSIVCATTDHLLLILARLTNFGGKDLKRKQEVIASRGGQWIPAPGFLEPGKTGAPGSNSSPMGGIPSPQDMARSEVKKEQGNHPPTANESRARKSKPATTSLPGHPSKPPPFYGMMPPASGPLHMHSSFHIMEAQLRSDLPEKVTSEPSHVQVSSLEVQTQNALKEHAAITEALEAWTSALGPDFEPLQETPETTVRTPFGPALRYADPLIACTWALYHMGRILQRRVHPHSPPAAMMSAGVNAQFTRDSAQIIGRIVGGLHAELQKATQLGRFDPVAIAATQETTFPLMFAAVQYQDAGQRGWTINKLRDVAEGSGWKSSTAVASACETTWHEMGKSGKGPPYEKTLDYRHVGVRGMGRHHSHRAADLGDASEAEKSYESQFVSHDRNFIDRHASTRAFWAMGVLSVEEDIKKLTLKS